MSRLEKPLQVNPIKLSAPMGATLAFLGVKDSMPLMHGAQGCASFTKVLFTRHFCEPIAIQTTAITDVTAVLDGGGAAIAEAVENISKKSSPKLIGLISTGLTETKGDDIRGACKAVTTQAVYVHTPDYEGGLESGWAKAVESIIDQIVEECSRIEHSTLLLLPNVNLTPIEIEKIKDFISFFGYKVYSLPDLSNSLDGYLGEKQGSISGGGIELKDIKKLSECEVVVSIGHSMKKAVKRLKSKNREIREICVDSLSGLVDSDKFVEELTRCKTIKPSSTIKRWRSRLCDMMLDAHFLIGNRRFALALEPDALVAYSKILSEVGGIVELAISPTKSDALKSVVANEVIVGDLEDLEKEASRFDLIITNTHGEAIAKREKKILILRGYPNYEEVGSSLINDVLYEGGVYFLKEVANTLAKEAHH